jgi:hypothetical protein
MMPTHALGRYPIAWATNVYAVTPGHQPQHLAALATIKVPATDLRIYCPASGSRCLY